MVGSYWEELLDGCLLLEITAECLVVVRQTCWMVAGCKE